MSLVFAFSFFYLVIGRLVGVRAIDDIILEDVHVLMLPLFGKNFVSARLHKVPMMID